MIAAPPTGRASLVHHPRGILAVAILAVAILGVAILGCGRGARAVVLLLLGCAECARR